MQVVTGVTPLEALVEDFEREFKCKNLEPNDCNEKGLQFPSRCSFPPCNQCSVESNGKLLK